MTATAARTVSDQAWFSPLTPLAHLERAAVVHRDRVAVVDSGRVYTYGELHGRSARLAGALLGDGIGAGGRVAVLSPNTHVLIEAHHGIAAAGGVLVAVNTRLAPAEIATILDHSGASLLISDETLIEDARHAVSLSHRRPRIISAGHDDSQYESWIAGAPAAWSRPHDEKDLLSLNYTSGTTGEPKGVMYHHRGAFLQSLAMAYHAGLTASSVYLWTLPMFHTNGWCFPWAVTLAGARHVCLRSIDSATIWALIRDEGVTHLCAAPTVLVMLAESEARHRPKVPLTIMTGGAPPTPSLLERLDDLGITTIHLYGLTETFGPALICDWHPEWNALPPADRAALAARQGVGNVVADPIRVVDREGQDVPPDGTALGEVAIRGNNLMLGYVDAPELTAAAIPDGWFRTGDLAVMHPDGYVELRDRRKDLIISGGENISSIEVERALSSHPDVLEAAVVAVADPKWGEVPVAVIETRPGTEPAPDELIAHLRDRIAGYKIPRTYHFLPLPRTSTGKIRKDLVRQSLTAGTGHAHDAGRTHGGHR